jgi:hypothetical protein
MNDLLVNEYVPGELNHFHMDSIIVDGIPSKRGNHLHSNLMFHLKQELDSQDNPSDTGNPMNWSPVETSETHWLQCGVLIPKNSLCPTCGVRGEYDRSERS